MHRLTLHKHQIKLVSLSAPHTRLLSRARPHSRRFFTPSLSLFPVLIFSPRSLQLNPPSKKRPGATGDIGYKILNFGVLKSNSDPQHVKQSSAGLPQADAHSF